VADFDFFPLLLSLRVAALAMLLGLVLGIPLAYLLSRKEFPGRQIAETLVLLPIVLPPSVLGYYLLIIIGRRSFIGLFLENSLGITLVFTWQAAVIAAAVVSVPLLVKSARAAFDGVDRELEEVAAVLGKSGIFIFFTVTLPLAWRGIAAGAALAFARALGDFGVTLIVAGNIPGRTQTMPVAVYDAILAGRDGQAGLLVLLMTAVALAVLMVLGRLEKSLPGGKRDA
jgi:molybdate transport system permease protein